MPYQKTKNPKKLLFVSNIALITDIAWQISKEGHQVKMYIEEKDYKSSGDGLVKKTLDWRKELDWADTIIFDDTYLKGQMTGAIACDLRKKGKYVIGGTPYTDRLEDDKSFGQSEMKKRGIKIIPYQEFRSLDSGIKYIKKHPEKYVFKPCGMIQDLKYLLYVSEEENGQDLIRLLQHYKKIFANKIKTFQLQKKVEGVEISVSSYFNGKKFVSPINVTFEHKKLFPGELGVATGEMGTSMFWAKTNKIFEKTLRKFEPKLKEEGYVGHIDINSIVDKENIYPLEFTCRFGYPQTSIQYEGAEQSFGDFLYGLAKGENIYLKTNFDYLVGVRLALPPFPYDDKKVFNCFAKNILINFRKPSLAGVHLEDVKLINKIWMSSSALIFVITGKGKTMEKAKRETYKRVKNIIAPNLFYRTDISDRWKEDGKRLKEWGYI